MSESGLSQSEKDIEKFVEKKRTEIQKRKKGEEKFRLIVLSSFFVLVGNS